VWEFQAVLSGQIAPFGPRLGAGILRNETMWALPPESVHGWIGSPGETSTIAVFHVSEVAGALRTLLGGHAALAVPLDEAAINETGALLRTAARFFHEQTAVSLLQFRVIADRLALLVAERLPPAGGLPVVDREELVVSRAEAILRAEMDSLVSVSELASRLGLSVAHLRRVFARRRGYPPRAARERETMRRARDELVSSNRGILDIALSFGYSSHSSFTKAYTRYWSETPRETRVGLAAGIAKRRAAGGPRTAAP
jgi:AraC-like DNA-binding protein